MKYTVTWGKRLVVVDYSGDIGNRDIESAHFELNSDDRFYGCDYFILNISQCNLDKVYVPDLITVIATDLGASITNNSMKVAMITTDLNSIAKASEYINKLHLVNSPWEYKILNSVKDANQWFGV